MKKIILLSAALILFFNARVMCQLTDADVVIFNADLQNLFNIQVMSGNVQTATFVTANDYNTGIPVVGSSVVNVESTEDWFCEVSAPNFAAVGGGATGTIPSDNIGLWCEAIGAYQFGAEIDLTNANVSLATALGIPNTDVMLFELGTGSNAGSFVENSFRMNWAMGTMDGSMHATSMLDQIAAGDFTLGQYTTTVTFTATQY